MSRETGGGGIDSTKPTGWGRAMRRCIQQWYLNKQPKHLAILLTKYPQRGGWSHRDLLRLAHPKIANDHANADDLKALVRFVVESTFIFYSIKIITF